MYMCVYSFYACLFTMSICGSACAHAYVSACVHVPWLTLEGVGSGHQWSSHPLVPACSLPQQGQSMSADGKGGRV